MSKNSFLINTRSCVRVLLYSTVAIGSITLVGFVGLNTYLEMKYRTPSSWAQKYRFSYRAARFNADYLLKNVAARQNVDLVIDNVGREIDGIPSDDHNVGLANALMFSARLYLESGDTLRAVTALERATELPVKEPKIRSEIFRLLAEAEESLGKTDAASAHYQFAVDVCGLQHGLQIERKKDLQLLSAMESQALFQARQGDLSLALTNLLKLLRMRNNDDKKSSREVCASAKVMSHIGQVVWALGDKSESKRWTLEALEVVQRLPNKSIPKECQECQGSLQNQLGLIVLDSGNFVAATKHFHEAVMLAHRVQAEHALSEYTQNLNECRRVSS